MQTLQFKTNGENIILSDLGQSTINGEAVPIVLYSFDPNSISISTDTVRCIGMPGQHTVSTTVNPRTLTVTVTYNGIAEAVGEQRLKDSEAAMYILRRKLLKAFPLGTKGELAFSNANGTYYLDAYVTEYPVVEKITGTLCKATLYFTADYPYWHQSVREETIELEAGDGWRVNPPQKGDLLSPLLFEVRCLEEITGIGTGEPYFTMWLDGADNQGVKIVKPLEENQSIVCSTGLNNEVYAELRSYYSSGDYYSSKNGSNYVEFYFRSDPALYPAYEYVFSAGGTGGKFLLDITYQNIFLAV